MSSMRMGKQAIPQDWSVLVSGFSGNCVSYMCACIQKLTAKLAPLQPQEFRFIEVFSGDGWVSKCMKAHGIPTASFDIRLGEPKEGKQDAMDLLSDAGFSFFGSITDKLFCSISISFVRFTHACRL